MGHCSKPPINLTMIYSLRVCFSIYLLTPLVVTGVICNFISISLWKHLKRQAPKKNTSCGYYLIVVGMVDSGVLINFFLCDTIYYLYPTITTNYAYNVFYAYIGFPLYMFLAILSFWLSVGAVTCRLTMVLYPIKFRQASTRITKFAIYSLIVVIFVVNMPNFLVHKAAYTNEGIPCLWKSSLLKTESYYNYRFWFQCVLLMGIPWLVIFVVNVTYVLRNYLSPSPYTQVKRATEMGRILFKVSIWLLVTIMLECIAKCSFLEASRFDPDWKGIDPPLTLGVLSIIFGSSAKLIVYLIESRRFRKAFTELIVSPPKAKIALCLGRSPTPEKENYKCHIPLSKLSKQKLGGASVNSVSNFTPNPKGDCIKDADSIHSNKEFQRKLFMVDITKIELKFSQ